MSDEYPVGYKRPPLHTRFRKGNKANPRGRPKGTRNFATDLVEELAETVLVREGDAAKKLTKQRALVKSLVARAIKGDARATANLLAAIAKTNDRRPWVDPVATADADRLVLALYEERLLRRALRAKAEQSNGTNDAVGEATEGEKADEQP